MKHVEQSAKTRLEIAAAYPASVKKMVQDGIQSVSDKYGIKQGEFYPMNLQGHTGENWVILGVPKDNTASSTQKYVIYHSINKMSLRWGEQMPHLCTRIVKVINFGEKIQITDGPEWAKKNVDETFWQKMVDAKLHKIPFKADTIALQYLNNLDKGLNRL